MENIVFISTISSYCGMNQTAAGNGSGSNGATKLTTPVQLPPLEKRFNITMKALLRRLEDKSRSEVEIANIDRLKRRISLALYESEDLIMIEATPFFVEFNKQISDHDENFFLSLDVRAEYTSRTKRAISPNDQFIFDVIDSTKNHYKNANTTERKEVFKQVTALLRCCLEYRAKLEAAAEAKKAGKK